MSSNTEKNKSKSYGHNVWIQFRQKRIVMFSLYTAILLFLVALYAPFIASRLPFIWHTPDGTVTYPFFREFFAPMDSREKLIEYLFNYLALCFPLSGILLLIFRHKAKFPILIGMILLLLPFISTTPRNQPAEYTLLEHTGNGHAYFHLYLTDLISKNSSLNSLQAG